MKLKRTRFIISGTFIFLAITFVAAQFIPLSASAAGSTIVACADKKTGALRIAYKKCTSKENSVTWGKAGTQGPAGATGARGLTGASGAQGQVGPQGLQGLQGPPGIEQVATKTVKYVKASNRLNHSCFDATPRDYAGEQYGFRYCFLEVTGNTKVFVLNVSALGRAGPGASGDGYSSGINVAPVSCGSIKIDRDQVRTDAEAELANTTVDGNPPYSYPNNVLYDHEYASVRSVGLPLYPNSGTRCLIWRAPQMGSTQWTLALVSD